MKLSIVGAGNVATVLAKKFFACNHTIVNIYSQTFVNATALANLVNAKPVDNVQALNDNIDLLIIAIADKSLIEFATKVTMPNVLVLHTAGSVSINVLQNCSKNYGVLYPVQSIRKTMDANTPIPFLIDGNNKQTENTILSIAQSISHKVSFGNDEQRLKLHIAAIFACNFVNYMYVQSESFCAAENIDFALLQPLIEETATRLRDNKPATVFTGPAVRGDINTIDKHLQLLQAYPNLQQLYSLLSNLILTEYKK